MSDERTTNEIDRRLGQRVRGRRLEIGMSQERLAALLGVTFQQVQKYEKGVNRIAASRLFNIAAALELPVGAFYEGLSSPQKASDDETHRRLTDCLLATLDGRTLVKVFASITNPRLRKRIVQLTQTLAEEDQEVRRKT